jgi:integrase
MPLKLIPPGQRKGNRFWLVRGSIAGKVYESSTGTVDEKASRRFAREFEAKIRAAPPDPTRVTFADAARRYVEYRSPSKPDRRRLERVVEQAGAWLLRDIRAGDIHQLATRMCGHLTPQTRNRHVILPIVTVMHYAYKAGFCHDWIKVPIFKEPRPRPRALAPEDAVALIEAADPALRRLLVWLFYQGTRITATLAIDWNQIDAKNQTVTIWNAKGDRYETFPLHDTVIAELGPKREGRVFPWTNRSSLDRLLKPLRAKTGIHFTPHMARHTLGTMMAANRESTRAIMGALGHTTPVMSLRYQAADVEMVRGAMNRVSLPQAKKLGKAS